MLPNRQAATISSIGGDTVIRVPAPLRGIVSRLYLSADVGWYELLFDPPDDFFYADLPETPWASGECANILLPAFTPYRVVPRGGAGVIDIFYPHNTVFDLVGRPKWLYLFVGDNGSYADVAASIVYLDLSPIGYR